MVGQASIRTNNKERKEEIKERRKDGRKEKKERKECVAAKTNRRENESERN